MTANSVLRKIGLHPDRAYNRGDSASGELSAAPRLGLDGDDISSDKRIRPYSSHGYPADAFPLATDITGQHDEETNLLRSPSNSNSAFPSLDQLPHEKAIPSDPLGLHLVCNKSRPRGDLIFVHGLGGTAKRTWSWNRDVKNFWPGWLAEEEDFSEFRILTYGYNSNFKGAGTTLNIIDFAKDLLFQMLVFSNGSREDRAPIGRQPIIFVAHSMGGLVVKKAHILGKHDGQYAHIISSIRGIMFLATPHRGSHYAKILNAILSTSLIGAPPKAYVEDLNTQSRVLQDINEQFRTSCGDVSLMSFYESFKTSFKIKKSIIVEKESATLGYPQELSNALNADHHTICKFKDRNDANYTSVKGILSLWTMGKSQMVVPRPSSPLRRSSSTFGLSKAIETVTGVREPVEDEFIVLRNEAMDGTCCWIRHKSGYSHWLEGREAAQGPKIFWLIGLPAMGKTILASYVIDHLLHNLGKDCQYHFFSASHQTKRTAAYCLRSIASQLAFTNKEFRDRLLSLHEDTGITFNSQGQNFSVIWEKIFEGIIFKLKLKPLYWVLDALDEADIPSKLINSLVKMRSQTPIRIFITSRPMRVPSGPATCGCQIYTCFLSEDDTRNDILTYVSEAVNELFPDDEQQVQDYVIKQVLSKAGGCFLWVKLVLETLRENWHTQGDIRKALTEMPNEMNDLYVRMLRKIEAQSSKLQLMAKAILTWVSLSWRPLSIDELQTALQPDFSGFVNLQETIVQICGNFISTTNEKVSLVHMTARQFLLNGQDSTPAFIDSTCGHEHIALVCLDYLCNERWKRVFKNIETSTRTARETAPKKNRLLLAEEGNSLLSYSVYYYAYHVSKSSSNSEHVVTTLNKFFTSYCLSWIEAIALSRNLRYLTSSARFLKAYAKRRSSRPALSNVSFPLGLKDSVSDDSQSVRLWAIDFIRIVGKFGPNLVQSPSSVYRLIPAFCPHDSMVGSTFGSQDRLISVTGLRSEGWDDCLASVSVGKEEAASQILATDIFFLTLLSTTGVVVVWSAETFEEVRKIEHGAYISSITLSRSQNLLVTAGSESYQIWDISSGRQLYRLEKLSRALTMVITFGNEESELIVGLDDCSVTSYDLETSKQNWQFVAPVSNEYHSCPLLMTISPDLDKVAMAWRGKSPVVWNIYESPSQRPLQCRIQNSTDPLVSPLKMQWQIDANSILILCHNITLIEWHIYEEEQRKFDHVKPHEMTISRDGNFLLTSNHAGTISVFTFPRLSLIYQLVNENEFIEDIALSPDSQRFYDLRGSICNVWEPDALVRLDESELEDRGSSIMTEPVIRRDESSQIQITALASGNADRFYCAGREDGTVCIHDAEQGRKLRKVSAHSTHSSIIIIAWSKSGRFIVSSDDSGRILAKRLELKPNDTFAVFPVFDIRTDEPVRQFLFSETERLLLISTSSSDRIWDLKAKKQKYSRTWNPDRGNRWIQHPFQTALLIWIDPFIVHTYSWEGLEHADPASTLPAKLLSPKLGSPHGSIVHWVALTTDKQYVVYLSGAGSSEHRLASGVHLEVLKMSDLQTQHPHLLASDCLADLAVQIKYLIGTYRDRIVFLDHDYWLCTWKIDAGLTEVDRHFFLPKDWLNHGALQMSRLNSHGTFFFPKHGDVAIVRNGMRL